MSRDRAVELLRREVTPELYHEVCELWKAHSLAEERHDIPGLIATLTEGCVYEVVPLGGVWRGHEGAARFYTELLSAFPDVTFALRSIVIGPQGVWEEAELSGTYAKDWLGFAATHERATFAVQIFFPWDPKRRKFAGERVWIDVASLRGGRG